MTVTLDDQLLGKAVRLTGLQDRDSVLRAALSALVARETARLGGSQPLVKPVPRHRPSGWPSRIPRSGSII